MQANNLQIKYNKMCLRFNIHIQCSCGSVVEHCVSNAKGCGFNSQGTHILTKNKKCISWLHCKSLWIKASAKCINVNEYTNPHRSEVYSPTFDIFINSPNSATFCVILKTPFYTWCLFVTWTVTYRIWPAVKSASIFKPCHFNTVPSLYKANQNTESLSSLWC